MKKISLALLLVLLIAAGCNSNPSENNSQHDNAEQTDENTGPGDSVEMIAIEKGFYSNYTDKKNLLIANQKDLEEMWNKAHALVQPAPSVPEVDFTKEAVVAVFMGQRSTGGYAVTIEKIIARGSLLEVHVAEKTPAGDSFTTQAFTQPFHIVKVSGNYSKAIFVDAK